MAPHGPLNMERYFTYSHFGLSQCTYKTNKPNHFKEMEAESTEILIKCKSYRKFRILPENIKHKTSGLCHIEDILTPVGPLPGKSYPSFSNSGFKSEFLKPVYA